MIAYAEQMELLRLISKNLSMDTECYAFGGTAMMFYGYKDETKDMDLLFEGGQERQEFIKAISALGFAKTSPVKIYIPEKLKGKHAPVMYGRGEIRFDLFAGKIFSTEISPGMKDDKYAVHDFKDKFNLRVNVLRKEHLVLLKAVTERERDFEDILTIVRKEKWFDWQYFVDEAIWQHQHGDSWAILDAEKMVLELKKYVFLEKKYLEQLYKAHGSKGGKKGKNKPLAIL